MSNPPAGTALVIDDVSVQRKLMSATCIKSGYEVEVARDGIEALELLETHRFDVVVTDLVMPRMDGIQLLRSLAKTSGDAKIIVASSQTSDVLDAVRRLTSMLGLDLIGICDTPTGLQELLRSISTQLANGPQPVKAPVAAPVQQQLCGDTIERGLVDQSLIVQYQPKICFAAREVIGLEALARWRLSDGTILSPYAFIPIAEEVGLIDRITQSLTRQVCGAIRRWRAAGYSFTVSINICSTSLQDPAFPDMLAELVTEHGATPSDIILEVTETKPIHEIAACLEVMSRLRMKGFGLSIDDFGTGYSSLENLHNFPFTEIKLDQSFVRGAIDNETSRNVLASGIRLASDLGLACVAEGVETEAQAALLSELGCPVHQGFLYAKPLAAAYVAAWAKGWEAAKA